MYSHQVASIPARSYNATLSKLWIDYGKNNVLADVTGLQPNTDRVYVYGSVTCDASARNVQVRMIVFFFFLGFVVMG